MDRIKETTYVTFCYMLVGVIISFILDPVYLDGLSDINRILVSLFVDFIIVKLSIDKVFNEFKSVSLFSGALISFILSFILAFYLNYSEFRDTYLLSELLAKIIFSELIVILMLFNIVYVIFRLLSFNGISRKAAELSYIPLIAITFLFSTVFYNQHIERLKTGNVYLIHFGEVVEDTLAGTNSEIENEINLVEGAFKQFICNFYHVGPREESLFDEVGDYIETNHSETDMDKIRNFLNQFLQGYNELRKQNSLITDKKINIFLNNEREKFKTTVLK